MRTIKRKLRYLILIIFCVLISFPSGAIAGDKKTVDKELAARSVGFERFAGVKLQELNRNHRLSRSRMQVTRLGNGTFRARFHQIDEDSLRVKVRRSQSSQIPFVGVATYQEKVYETSAVNPEALDEEDFSVVKIIPNRHIFSYKGGLWN